MKLTTHISFCGNCEAAFKFYEKALGGKISFMAPFEGSPMAGHAPPGWEKKVMHATLQVGGTELTGDDFPGDPLKPQAFILAINTADQAEAERVFNTLSENGKVTMPLQQTFWASRFGTITDQFGIPWMINCE
jgi:PhnB protein